MRSLLLLPLCLIHLFSWGFCQQTVDSLPKKDSEKIIAIVYNYGGGEPGFDITYTIREDSILYNADDYSQKIDQYVHTKIQKPNASQSWSKLTKSINLSDFFKLKGGTGERQYDGLDYRIIIKTLDRQISLILSKDNYAEMKVFLAAVEIEIKKIDKKFKIHDQY